MTYEVTGSDTSLTEEEEKELAERESERQERIGAEYSPGTPLRETPEMPGWTKEELAPIKAAQSAYQKSGATPIDEDVYRNEFPIDVIIDGKRYGFNDPRYTDFLLHTVGASYWGRTVNKGAIRSGMSEPEIRDWLNMAGFDQKQQDWLIANAPPGSVRMGENQKMEYSPNYGNASETQHSWEQILHQFQQTGILPPGVKSEQELYNYAFTNPDFWVARIDLKDVPYVAEKYKDQIQLIKDGKSTKGDIYFAGYDREGYPTFKDQNSTYGWSISGNGKIVGGDRWWNREHGPLQQRKDGYWEGTGSAELNLRNTAAKNKETAEREFAQTPEGRQKAVQQLTKTGLGNYPTPEYTQWAEMPKDYSKFRVTSPVSQTPEMWSTETLKASQEQKLADYNTQFNKNLPPNVTTPVKPGGEIKPYTPRNIGELFGLAANQKDIFGMFDTFTKGFYQLPGVQKFQEATKPITETSAFKSFEGVVNTAINTPGADIFVGAPGLLASKQAMGDFARLLSSGMARKEIVKTLQEVPVMGRVLNIKEAETVVKSAETALKKTLSETGQGIHATPTEVPKGTPAKIKWENLPADNPEAVKFADSLLTENRDIAIRNTEQRLGITIQDLGNATDNEIKATLRYFVGNPDKVPNVDSIIIGHGTGVGENWVVKGTNKTIDSLVPEGKTAYVIACETSTPRNFATAQGKIIGASTPGGTVPPVPPFVPPPPTFNQAYQAVAGGRTPPNVDPYTKFMEMWNDATWGLRNMQSKAAARGVNIIPGGEMDIKALYTRAPGVTNAGATRADLVYREIKKIAPDVVADDINSVINANHYKEVLVAKGAGRVMPGGFTQPQQLDAFLTQLEARLGTAKYNQAVQAAEVVQRTYQYELQRMVTSGLIDSATANLLATKYPWYNPIRYAEYLDQIPKGTRANPKSVIESGLKKLSPTGTANEALKPLDIMPGQLVQNELRIVKNDTAKALIKLGLTDANLGLQEIPSTAANIKLKNVISFFEDGTRHTYKVPEFMYREAVTLTNLIKNPAISLIGAMNGVSRAAFTSLSPAFIFSNMANDMLTAFVRGGIMPHQSAMQLIQSLKSIENDLVGQAYRLTGGLQARFYGQDLAKQVIKSGNDVLKPGENLLSKIWKAIPTAGELGEQAPRRAEFVKQLNKNLPGWKQMTAEQIAATPEGKAAAAKAVELTINFGRGGYLIKSANPLLIFLNANMEGMKLPFRTLAESPAAQMRLASTMLATAGLDTYNMTYPEYFDIPDNIRWGSVIVMLPSKEKDYMGRNKPNYVIVIPRTREWAAFLGTKTFAMEKLFTKNPTDFGTFSATMAPMLLPFAEIPLPAAAQTLTENITNWDFYVHKPIVPLEMQGLPVEQQVQPWTSPTAAAIGRATGISPLIVQNTISGIFGGTGQAFTSVTDYIASMIAPAKVEQRIVSLAEQYKNLTGITEKNNFTTKIPQEDKDMMFAYLRTPEKGVPIISSIVNRFYSQRGGQLYATGQKIAEKQTGLSAKETQEVSKLMSKVEDKLITPRNQLSDEFQSGKITGLQWKRENSEIAKQKQDALTKLGLGFPKAAQVQKDPTLTAKYYDTINTLAGTMPDMRDKASILVSAWYAIDMPDNPTPEEVTQFYERRDAFKTSLSTEDWQLTVDRLRSEFNPTEKLYAKTQDVLQPYWNIENNILSQVNPQTKDLYKEYQELNAKGNSGEAKQLLNNRPNLMAVYREILNVKRDMRTNNEDVRNALNLFYNYQ